MLPIILTQKQKVLIVGAGRACRIKLKSLLELQYDITVVSKEFDVDFDYKVHKIIDDFYNLDEPFFEEFDMIYIAIALHDNVMIKKLLKNKLVNVLSDISLSNFRHPCTRQDQDIILSVSNLKQTDPKRACKFADSFLEYKKALDG